MIGSRMHVKLWQHMNWHTAFRVVQIHHMKTIIKPYLTASKKRISHIFRRLEFKVFFPTPDDIPDSRRDTVTNAVSVASVVTPPLKDKQDKSNQFWIGFAGNWLKFDLTLKNVLHFQQLNILFKCSRHFAAWMFGTHPKANVETFEGARI